MKYFPKVMGERLYLSPICPEDAPIYTCWLNDPAVTANIGMASIIISVDAERKALEALIEKGYTFAIIRRDDHTLIGNTGFDKVNHLSRSAECGIFIGDAENRGKGYGTEALELLLGYGFKVLNFHNILLKVFSFNTAAIKCYKKLGFRVIGERRENYFYNGAYHNDVYLDMLAEEYFAHHPGDKA